MRISIVFFFCLSVNIILAQQSDLNKSLNDSSVSLLKNVLKDDSNLLIDDIFGEIVKPLEFNGNDWIKFGAIAGLTGFFITQDQSIKDVVNKNHNQSLEKLNKITEIYGSANSSSILPLSFYLSGLILKNEDLRTTGRILFESLLVSGLIVQTIKISFGRARPYINEGAYSFKPLKFDNDYNSFSSGHTIVAFTISAVLSRRFNNIFASIGLYTLAGLTAYQRIYSDKHWFSDTFLSAVIGIVVGNSFVDIQEKNKKASDSSEFSLAPQFNNNFKGISIGFRF